MSDVSDDDDTGLMLCRLGAHLVPSQGCDAKSAILLKLVKSFCHL